MIVDDRWRGEHGIGRFATEVVARLAMPWRALGGNGSPTSILDVISLRRTKLSSTTVLYSPGFNAGFTRARQILTIHDLIHLQIASEKSFAKALYYNAVVKRAIKQAGVVMTVSATSARAIAVWLGTASVEIVVVGCGRSRAFAIDGPTASFDLPTFLYVGNLKPHKNVGVLFKAVAMRPNFDLIVVTSDVEQAEAAAAAAGVSERVSIRTGLSDDELASLYRGAAGALQPSILEGFGLPALEAMACGTPVASWSGCESVQEIRSGTGVTVESATSADEWARSMDTLVEQSAAGPLIMPVAWNELYSWDGVGDRVSAVIGRA
ncbi:glycosyltransferase family 4 protein [Cryobacterium arcticum]|uniref:Glycosyltransferase family 1 protein n=1 Tax=Cryobacterium arcticum TaxID=670052 RepID=A0A317ZWW8_9MICO|nr:glycosyltransferase family 1 protein [Cryobacterium arcticum]PXA68667.1 glycosyltransferase family 1 protein [Cryobacterium arcticum]